MIEIPQLNNIDNHAIFIKNKKEQFDSFYYLVIVSLTLFSIIIIFSIYMMYVNYDEEDLISIFHFDLNPTDYKLLNS
jgi:hypothetical protein